MNENTISQALRFEEKNADFVAMARHAWMNGFKIQAIQAVYARSHHITVQYPNIHAMSLAAAKYVVARDGKCQRCGKIEHSPIQSDENELVKLSWQDGRLICQECAS